MNLGIDPPPLLALGINENERYFLEFDFYRINQFGHFEKYYFIEIRGASMIALQMNFDTRSGHDTECVTLAYDYIRCRHLIAATEYYHFALPANYNSLFSVQNPIVAARNAAQRSALNSANVGRLLAAGGVYHQNPQGFKKVAEQLGGDAPKGFNQVLNEQSAGTLMAMGAMIGLGKGAASHIPSLDKVKKTQRQLLVEKLNQKQESAIKKIDNTIKNALKDHDIKGTLKDMEGNPVPKKSGGYWDHMQEMNNTLRGLRNNADALKNVNNPEAQAAYTRAADAINKIESAIKGYGI